MGAQASQRPFTENDTRDRVLAFIASYARTNGFGPSIREIGEACDIASSSTVHYHLVKLSEQGKITRRDGLNRAIAVVKETPVFDTALARLNYAVQALLIDAYAEDEETFNEAIAELREARRQHLSGEPVSA